AVQLELWQVRRVVGFDAFAENVIGLPLLDARELVRAAAARLGAPAEILPPWARAVMMRIRAAASETIESLGAKKARFVVRATGSEDEPRIVLDLPARQAAAILAAAGGVL